MQRRLILSKDVTLTNYSLKIGGDIIKQTDNNMPYLFGTNYNIKMENAMMKILEIIEIARGAFNSMLKTITLLDI